MTRQPEEILKRIRISLASINRSRAWLARTCGINKSTVDGWFAGNRVPPMDQGVAIAQALETTVEYLVTGRDTRRDHLDPDFERICSLLEELGPDQLTELRGVVQHYVEAHFWEGQQEGEHTAG